MREREPKGFPLLFFLGQKGGAMAMYGKKQERLRGSDGRFKARTTRAVLPDAVLAEKPPQPAQSVHYIRRKLAQHLPEILWGLIDGARQGSCPHVKLATDLLQPAQKPVKRKTSSLGRLLQQVRQDEKTREKTAE